MEMNLQQTLSNFFEVPVSRISIDGNRATLIVDDDAAVFGVQARWSDATYLFGDRIQYLVVEKGARRVELPLKRKLWESGGIVK
ncbi:hypothetical protein H6F89_01675 [Cyanobacteria bacterium FACHB-63]|nr:hypothetical protein [Cyanobacteria bacterium FACHB-63]